MSYEEHIKEQKKIIENIKQSARTSITLNRFWEDIHFGIGDKEDILEAISELLDEPEKPVNKVM
jgi:hypothetical protein